MRSRPFDEKSFYSLFGSRKGKGDRQGNIHWSPNQYSLAWLRLPRIYLTVIILWSVQVLVSEWEKGIKMIKWKYFVRTSRYILFNMDTRWTKDQKLPAINKRFFSASPFPREIYISSLQNTRITSYASGTFFGKSRGGGVKPEKCTCQNDWLSHTLWRHKVIRGERYLIAFSTNLRQIFPEGEWGLEFIPVFEWVERRNGTNTSLRNSILGRCITYVSLNCNTSWLITCRVEATWNKLVWLSSMHILWTHSSGPCELFDDVTFTTKRVWAIGLSNVTFKQATQFSNGYFFNVIA